LKRRQFITLLGGATAWPMTARAQQTGKLPTIGWLDSSGRTPPESRAAFNRGLAESGYVVGRNVDIEYRSAENDNDRLRPLAAEFVRHQVAVIVPTSGTAAQAAKAATLTIPIVFNMGGDPVEDGLVASLNRPGGNMTGVTILVGEIAAKRFELLHELVPKAQSIAVLVRAGPDSSDLSRAELKGFQSAALALGVRLLQVNAITESDIAGALANAVQQRAGALLVRGAGVFSVALAPQIISLANRYALPTMFNSSNAVAAGALASYGTDTLESYRQMGIYTGRILKGEKPGDLPVVQPTKFELAINLKTAKALGITVPPTLLVAADKVIE
jgi:putative ABC transport system substrate-binding protein